MYWAVIPLSLEERTEGEPKGIIGLDAQPHKVS